MGDSAQEQREEAGKLRICITLISSNLTPYLDYLYRDYVEILPITPESVEESVEAIELAHGLVLVGGVDIHPSCYGSARTDYPGAPRIDEFHTERDRIELEIYRRAARKNIPVFAICRGMQLVNVFHGGTLIQDLVETGAPIHYATSGLWMEHPVDIAQGSLLHQARYVVVSIFSDIFRSLITMK
jgi:gamma-glutamyl-gamma-aminobutyrate hydrolase PuuD